MIEALRYTDLILYDLKLIDSDLHQKYVGVPNGTILKNARLTAEHHAVHGSPEIWIRTPVIPNITDTEENIAGIGKFIAENLNEHIDRWELCAFNNLCVSKYERLGINWAFRGVPLMEKAQMEKLLGVARHSGVDEKKILWTGSARAESRADRNEGGI
jgi:pyruvate formate lyase activating enzyme